jgi:hypothetical protein
VSRSRTLLVLLLIFGLLAALGPALALADGGSAGDQQYVDPLAGVHSHSGNSSASSSTTPTTTSATDATTAVTTPTATSAATTSPADPSGKSKNLPFTGFEDWQVAGLGAVLLAGGLVIRRRATH